MTTKSWERCDNESDESWEAFVSYRDMAPRSNARVARQLGKSVQLVDRWSSRHSWQARVILWDREQDRAWLDELAAARKDAARTQWSIATTMLEKVQQSVETIAESDEPLAPSDAAKWVEVAGKALTTALSTTDGAAATAADLGRLLRAPRRSAE